jgi:hypothetical protein
VQHVRLTLVRLSRLSCLSLCAVGLLACSSDATPAPAVNGSAPVLTPGEDPSAAACAGSTSARPPNSSCVGVVRGQLIDAANAPVSSPVTVCGGGVLCTGSTADEGLFTVNVHRFVDLSTFVFWVHGFPNHADMILPLQRATTSDITLTGIPRVPRYESAGDVLPPSSAMGGVFRSGPVELTLAAGTQTVVAPAHENARALVVGTVPDPSKWGPDLVALYALGPPGARFAPTVDVALTLPDGAAIPDGTKLDLVVLDDDLLGGHPGTLITAGSVTVTKGVARSVAGTTLDRLTWVGVRVPQGH